MNAYEDKNSLATASWLMDWYCASVIIKRRKKILSQFTCFCNCVSIFFWLLLRNIVTMSTSH